MIAYFILVHRYPAQFKRLFLAIYRPENYYAIHVDKRSDPTLRPELVAFLSAYPNVVVLESKNALWGGYSLVEAELRGILALLAMGKWKFFINLSGQDFPLKTQRQINAFLNKNKGKDFLKVADQEEKRPGTMDRVVKYCVELSDRIIRTPFSRRFLRGAVPYIGNQWMILSRGFCEFLRDSPEIKRFVNFYRHTFIADEGFFQTVLMNTAYVSDLVNDDLRAIDWVPDGTIKLRPRTFVAKDAAFLLKSRNLFARKFDTTVDAGILDILEAHLTRVKKQRPTALSPALSVV